MERPEVSITDPARRDRPDDVLEAGGAAGRMPPWVRLLGVAILLAVGATYGLIRHGSEDQARDRRLLAEASVSLDTTTPSTLDGRGLSIPVRVSGGRPLQLVESQLLGGSWPTQAQDGFLPTGRARTLTLTTRDICPARTVTAPAGVRLRVRGAGGGVRDLVLPLAIRSPDGLAEQVRSEVIRQCGLPDLDQALTLDMISVRVLGRRMVTELDAFETSVRPLVLGPFIDANPGVRTTLLSPGSPVRLTPLRSPAAEPTITRLRLVSTVTSCARARAALVHSPDLVRILVTFANDGASVLDTPQFDTLHSGLARLVRGQCGPGVRPAIPAALP